MLERTRIINKLLQQSEKVQYDKISHVLSSVINANAYIVNRDGHILGYTLLDNFECELMFDTVLQKGLFPNKYVDWLLRVYDVSPNLCLKDGLCAFSEGTKCLFSEKFTTIIPIFGGGERIGTLLVAKFHDKFTDDDLLLAEYGATVVGMEILRDRTDKIAETARQKATVLIAIGTLSYSELEAVTRIFNELEGNEGLVVASQIADKFGITRSVVVNALRKFESAGVIHAQSLGMKGTYLKVLNEYLLEALKK
jgi:transcriptional pleiotropic repressor